jgi:glycerol-3-phosphate dehydrogenase (NAD(P)+)
MNVCVLGGGSWGIALAVLLRGNGKAVSLWEFNEADADILRAKREHESKLPGIRIPSPVSITSALEVALRDAQMLFFAIPSHTIRSAARKLESLNVAGAVYVNCAKGIELETHLRMSEVLIAEIPAATESNVVTLSGPSHAEEVSRGLPTSAVVAGKSRETCELVQKALNNERFRVYTSPDIIGVELGGSVKNIIAIAAGICSGLGFGDNTTGALLTRGLAEISRLGRRLGADPLTFAGLSGLGDLVTTCISRHSRNRYLGLRIGEGLRLREVLAEMVMVAEGVNTTNSVYHLSKNLGVEMPITEQVYRILFEEKDPRLAVRELMGRDLKAEI